LFDIINYIPTSFKGLHKKNGVIINKLEEGTITYPDGRIVKVKDGKMEPVSGLSLSTQLP